MGSFMLCTHLGRSSVTLQFPPFTLFWLIAFSLRCIIFQYHEKTPESFIGDVKADIKFNR